ncbi:hypothetical protein CI610_03525 [invertebrate metagenome]|uniref:Uncharacterized protein n=1 Tax=invertebrate metagenome TaxID=1711999 RepID=A0A2H9T2U9_9ZZZZ
MALKRAVLVGSSEHKVLYILDELRWHSAICGVDVGADLVQAEPSPEESSDVNVHQQFRTSSDVIGGVGEFDVRAASVVQSILKDGVCVSGLDPVDEVRETLLVADLSPNL